MPAETFNVLIGGKAGEGVKKAAQVLAHLAMAAGKHVFQTDDYQSLIKGGHNFSVVSISDSKLYNSYSAIDLIISLTIAAFANTQDSSSLEPFIL
ncbi:MAG: 2-oxoacid:acceptor oxidoreductase family protein [Candidatus Cloacimonetes bacterium]|nr:2-oxoacid:acceptor oxidoreductase family protein [Candidatus Cloacimonadota bacterium]